MLRDNNLQQNSSLIQDTDAQPKQQTNERLGCLAKLAMMTSYLCSGIAVSLFVANYFGSKDVFKIKIVGEACKYVHGILTASVVLGFVAMVLSPSKPDENRCVAVADSDTTLDRSTEIDPRTETKFRDLTETTKTSKCRNKAKADNSIPVANSAVILKDSDSAPSNVQQCKTLPASPPRRRPSFQSKKAVVPYYGTQTQSNDEHSKVSSFCKSFFSGHSSNRVPHQMWSVNINNMPKGKTVTEFVPSNASTREFASTNTTSSRYVGIHSVTEYIASNRIRYFAGEGKVQSQEEFKIRRITNFYPETKFPNRFGPHPKSDRVSDVTTKMEALQFFY